MGYGGSPSQFPPFYLIYIVMAIFIETKTPEKLLNLIHIQIDAGIIKKWACDKEGDFSCLREDLVNRAWLRPYLLDDFLAFGIVGRKNVPLSIESFSEYHSEFVKMLLSHMGSQAPSIIVKSPFDNIFDTNNIENSNEYEL